MFLRGPDQGSRTKVENKTRSHFVIVIITYLVRFNVTHQRVRTLNVLNTEVRGTLQITDDALWILLVPFSRILHKERRHTNSKEMFD